MRTTSADSPRRESAVHSISALPPSPAQDRDSRMRVYALSMGIRTVSFAAAAITAIVEGPGWLVWVCVAAAVLLPYPAVVAANNVNRRGMSVPVSSYVHRELHGGADDPADRS